MSPRKSRALADAAITKPNHLAGISEMRTPARVNAATSRGLDRESRG